MENLNSSPMELITPMSALVMPFIIIGIVCECGEQVTERFHLFNDKLSRCKWYLFTPDVQRMLLIFMSDAQQPAYIRGFGNIVCARDSFKKV